MFYPLLITLSRRHFWISDWYLYWLVQTSCVVFKTAFDISCILFFTYMVERGKKVFLFFCQIQNGKIMLVSISTCLPQFHIVIAPVHQVRKVSLCFILCAGFLWCARRERAVVVEQIASFLCLCALPRQLSALCWPQQPQQAASPLWAWTGYWSNTVRCVCLNATACCVEAVNYEYCIAAVSAAEFFGMNFIIWDSTVKM